jgi:hypothetical protein
MNGGSCYLVSGGGVLGIVGARPRYRRRRRFRLRIRVTSSVGNWSTDLAKASSQLRIDSSGRSRSSRSRKTNGRSPFQTSTYRRRSNAPRNPWSTMSSCARIA